MKKYNCKKCKTELHYHQIQGMRLVRENKNGKLVYDVYCHKCQEYFEEEK